jgi:predicted transport protein
MSDIKLFDIRNGTACELEGRSVALEKSLQTLMEKHLDTFLGVKFLASEYSTGPKHGGRIDTLGLDENGCPVIIEYKRSLNENVINQGLYYLDWLLDHKAEFKLLVMEQLGKEAAEHLEWSSPRLICIAGDFTKYDEYAVKQINRDIELMRYRKYGDDYLLFEMVTAVQATGTVPHENGGDTDQPKGTTKTKVMPDILAGAPQEVQDRFEHLKEWIMNLGDEIQYKPLRYYLAFKRIKNFACAVISPQNKAILVYVKVPPDSIELSRWPNDQLRDVRGIGHHGVGDLEIKIRDDDELEHAKELILQSYEIS